MTDATCHRTRNRNVTIPTCKIHTIIFVKILERTESVVGNWNYVSASAKDLVRKMLDLDPHRRLTTAQVITHPWIQQRNTLPENQLAMQDARLVKGAVAATYRAISQSPLAPHLAPVQSSQLAIRRRKSRPKTTTDV